MQGRPHDSGSAADLCLVFHFGHGANNFGTRRMRTQQSEEQEHEEGAGEC